MKTTAFLSNQISRTALSHVKPPHRISVSSFGLMEFVLKIFLLITAFEQGSCVLLCLRCFLSVQGLNLGIVSLTICTFCCLMNLYLLKVKTQQKQSKNRNMSE
ncbi:Hypothetical_protein [Hexamita inflata]|uniref:Hypothetical_protein n=1 Tax=Hexamita inflata TaxID=28002 RepID=A0AA86PKY7_9EUKA|nr:Hypothetical protein HINF_LOCUS27792 [Hexamita inflata]